MTKDRKFYREFFSLCLILMLQNVIVIAVNLADNIMLGSYSEAALSGAAAVNHIQFIYQQLLTAAGEGVVILGSQYLGRGQSEPVKRVTATALKTGLLVGILLTAAATLVPVQLIGLFTENRSIVAQGVEYLKVIRFTYLFFCITVILEAALRCAGMVKISLYLSVMTFFVNCGINYILIYGKFGMPQMGITGAAIGTLTARILECMIIMLYAADRKHSVTFRLKELWTEDARLRKDYLHHTVFMMITHGLWGLNTSVQTMVLGHLSDSAIAANSISSTLYTLMKSASVGAASSAAVITGKAVGAEDYGRAKNNAYTMQILFISIGAVMAAVLFFVRIPVLSLYSLSDETRTMANTFLMLQCLFYLGMSYQMPVNNGIIRSGGSPQFVVKLDLICIWCIAMPLSLIMAFVVKASPVVVFCCLSSDQIFKCVPVWIKVNRGKWIRNLTRPA